MRRIIISGSRDFCDEEVIEKAMLEMIGTTPLHEIMIITGGARGVDKVANSIAKRIITNRAIFPAFWKVYNNAAGPIRNRLMLGTADEVLAFPTKDSIGTRDMVKIAEKAGLIVKVIEV